MQLLPATRLTGLHIEAGIHSLLLFLLEVLHIVVLSFGGFHLF